MSSERAKGRIVAWRYLKAVIGFALLVAIAYWVSRRGDLLQRLTLGLVLPPSIAALVSVAANALTLRFIVRSHGKNLGFRQALIVSAAGTLGNALGGLPVGTGLKYWVVRRTSGLGVKDLTIGLILMTIVISGSLLLFVTASVWFVDLPVRFKAVPALTLILGVALVAFLRAREHRRSYWIRYLAPYLAERGRLRRLTILGFMTAVSLIVNYLVACHVLYPRIQSSTVVFVASLGMLAGQGTLLQSVGGVQELLLGLSAHIVGVNVIAGVQLALLLRIAAVIAAAVLVSALYGLPAAKSRFQRRRGESQLGMLVFVVFAASVLAGVVKSAASAGRGNLPSEALMDGLSEQCTQLWSDLQSARGHLLARAELESRELIERIALRQPARRRHGYQILPSIVADQEERSVIPVETRYSLESLQTRFDRASGDAADLSDRAGRDSKTPILPMIEELETLHGEYRSLEDHLAYHRAWQPTVVEDSLHFAEQNRIHEMVRRWSRMREATGGSDLDSITRSCADSMRRAILRELAPFRPVPGIELDRTVDGKWILPVSVVTDIVDPAFLEHFSTAVSAAFTESEAAQAARFEVDLTLRRTEPSVLYPDGAPGDGEPIPEGDHLGRFPKDSLVLTTGATRTRAYPGHCIQLGSEPRSPRSLAHEFGHLLGFRDAYLRAFEGDPRSAMGCVLVEWAGLQSDLMGDPNGGQVTHEMIAQLIDAYARPLATGPAPSSGPPPVK